MRNHKYITAVAAALCLLGAARAQAANTLTVTPASGNPGERVTVKVSLTSDAPVSALQLTAELGEGVTAVNGSAKAGGRASGHAASCGTKEGVTTLMLYSTAMAAIPAGTGDIAEFDLQLGARPVHTLPAITVKATDASGKEVACTGSGLEVKVLGATAEYPAGPAYDFGRVPIRGNYTLDVPVTNAGTTELVIDNATFSAREFTCVTPLPYTVAPGATGNITVGYAPTLRGEVSATVTVSSNSSLPDNTLRLLAAPFAVNEVRFGSVSGSSDTEVVIPVTVNNMDAVTGFTFEFNLPDHIRYVDGSFELSDRATDHKIVATSTDGTVRATAYSMTDSPFTGDDGVLATFRVRLSGRYGLMLYPTKAVLSALVDGKVTDVTSATYPGNISIMYPQIYTYGSLSLGRTPITESAEAYLYVNNYGSAPLIIERITADGIDVSLKRQMPLVVSPWGAENIGVTLSGTEEGRLGGTLQIYSNDPDMRLTNVEVSAERYAPNFIGLRSEQFNVASGECEVYVSLDNYDAISGLQFDVALPDGFTPAETATTARSEGFTAVCNKVGAGVYRYFVYSLGGAHIQPGTGDVLTLPFTYADDVAAGDYTVRISDVKLSNPEMADRSSMLEGVNATMSLIEVMAGDLNADRELNTTDLNLMVSLISTGNTAGIVKLAADLNDDGNYNTTDLNILIEMILNRN